MQTREISLASKTERMVMPHPLGLGIPRGMGSRSRPSSHFKGMLRVHLLSLEERTGQTIPCGQPVKGGGWWRTATISSTAGGKRWQNFTPTPQGPQVVRDLAGIWEHADVSGLREGTRGRNGGTYGRVSLVKADVLAVRSRAVRESSRCVTVETLDVLRSTPQDPTGTMRAARRKLELVRPRRQRREVTDPIRETCRYRGRSPRDWVGGCQKRRAIAAGDP